MRPRILLTAAYVIIALALLWLPLSAHEVAALHQHRGEYILYANPQGYLSEPSDSAYWPIIAGWGQVTYISDSVYTFYEPRIAITDSIIHVLASTVLWGAGYFRSYDGGQTWQFITFFDDTTSNVSPRMVALYSENARLYTTWDGRRGDIGTGFVQFRASSDYGQSWPVTAELRLPRSIYDATYGNVAAHGDTVFVSFVQGFYTLTCWSSVDGGRTWHNPGRIAEETAGYAPSITYGAGIVSIAFNFINNDVTDDVFYIRSTDGGQSWGYMVFLGFDDYQHGQWPEIAADSLGNVAVCWMDYIGSPYGWTGGIWVRVSHDYGVTWGEAVRLDSDYKGEAGTSVVVDGDYIGVVWGASGATARLCYRESWDGGVTWRPEENPMEHWWAMVPRLQKQGSIAHIIWNSDEPIEPPQSRRFIKYVSNDELNGVVDDSPSIKPNNVGLGAYPNPFNSSTIVTLNDGQGGEETISIYDIMGRHVMTLSLKEGKATWDATDNAGQQLASGVYFARIETPQGANTLKLLYLK